MILCQISDLHIKPTGKLAYGIVDTAALLERAVARILRLPQRPDAVIATGDLVDQGRPDEYALLRELLAPLPMPVYLLPGNHDERAALRAAFPDHAYLRQWQPFVQYAIDAHPLRIVALDTVVALEGGGWLCPQRLAWLEATLAASTQPTVVAMHHPPFATGIGHMDRIALANADEFAAVIVRHPQVMRIVCGHVHRSVQTMIGATLASICPSTAHQVALDLSADGPDQFVMEPPAVQLHVWNGTCVVTHTAGIGDFAGPYPFRNSGRLIT